MEGETITLNGQQAFEFVRTRKDVDDQTNLARMERQRVYLEAMKPQLMALSDTEIVQVMEEVNDYLVSNIGSQTVLDLAEKLKDYQELPELTIEGENTIEDGHWAYILNEDSLQRVIPAAVLPKKSKPEGQWKVRTQRKQDPNSRRWPSANRPKKRSDLVELFYLLWGHMLQIIACVIVGGAAAFAYTYFMVMPMYQATAKMYVASATYNSIVDIYDMQLGSQLALDYQELILSRPLMEDVAEALELDIEPAGIASMVSVNNPEDTRIIEITVTCPDPQLAADLANEIAYQASVHLPRIMEEPCAQHLRGCAGAKTEVQPQLFPQYAFGRHGAGGGILRHPGGALPNG